MRRDYGDFVVLMVTSRYAQPRTCDSTMMTRSPSGLSGVGIALLLPNKAGVQATQVARAGNPFSA